MIKVEHLNKSYNNNSILENISFSITRKEIAILYGRNGVGKTTLLKCILGLITPSKGKCTLVAIDKIGVVLNEGMLINKMTVNEYLNFIGFLKEVSQAELSLRIEKLLKDLDLFEEKNRMIEELSSGMKSKLKLIASLLFEPEILLLDEPFSGMDILSMESSIKLIKRCADMGCAVLISTHNINVVENFSSDVLVLKDKTIKKIISKKSITENRNSLKELLMNSI